MAQETRHPFWQTLPGMLTAVAGIIAAVTGLTRALSLDPISCGLAHQTFAVFTFENEQPARVTHSPC